MTSRPIQFDAFDQPDGTTLESRQRFRDSLVSTPPANAPTPTPEDEFEEVTPPIVQGGTFDFKTEAAKLYPWLPPQLIDLFVGEYTRTGGEVQLALELVRSSPQYEQYFPGIKRADGSLRMDEQQYAQTIDRYRKSLTARGIRWDLPGMGERFSELIEGEVSTDEFEFRVQTLENEVMFKGPAVMAMFAQHRGIDNLDFSSILAAAISPQISEALLNREITTAQIRAEGAQHGFDLSYSGLQGFIDRGLDAQAGAQILSAAEFGLPNLSGAARRQGTSIGIEDVLGSAIGDVDPARTISRVTATELAANIGGSRIQSLRPR